MSAKLTDKLMKQLSTKLFILFDKRSLISFNLLSQAYSNCKKTEHNGGSLESNQGEILFVIMVGDEYQFSSVKNGVLYLQLPRSSWKENQETNNYRPPLPRSAMEAKEKSLWQEFARDVMELSM